MTQRTPEITVQNNTFQVDGDYVGEVTEASSATYFVCDFAFGSMSHNEAMRSADALLPTVSDAITSAVLSVSPRRAKIVANFGVGYNNIDVATARSLGIVVTNTPDVLTDATAAPDEEAVEEAHECPFV